MSTGELELQETVSSNTVLDIACGEHRCVRFKEAVTKASKKKKRRRGAGGAANGGEQTVSLHPVSTGLDKTGCNFYPLPPTQSGNVQAIALNCVVDLYNSKSPKSFMDFKQTNSVAQMTKLFLNLMIRASCVTRLGHPEMPVHLSGELALKTGHFAQRVFAEVLLDEDDEFMGWRFWFVSMDPVFTFADALIAVLLENEARMEKKRGRPTSRATDHTTVTTIAELVNIIAVASDATERQAHAMAVGIRSVGTPFVSHSNPANPSVVFSPHNAYNFHQSCMQVMCGDQRGGYIGDDDRGVMMLTFPKPDHTYEIGLHLLNAQSFDLMRTPRHNTAALINTLTPSTALVVADNPGDRILMMRDKVNTRKVPGRRLARSHTYANTLKPVPAEKRGSAMKALEQELVLLELKAKLKPLSDKLKACVQVPGMTREEYGNKVDEFETYAAAEFVSLVMRRDQDQLSNGETATVNALLDWMDERDGQSFIDPDWRLPAFDPTLDVDANNLLNIVEIFRKIGISDFFEEQVLMLMSAFNGFRYVFKDVENMIVVQLGPPGCGKSHRMKRIQWIFPDNVAKIITKRTQGAQLADSHTIGSVILMNEADDSLAANSASKYGSTARNDITKALSEPLVTVQRGSVNPVTNKIEQVTNVLLNMASTITASNADLVDDPGLRQRIIAAQMSYRATLGPTALEKTSSTDADHEREEQRFRTIGQKITTLTILALWLIDTGVLFLPLGIRRESANMRMEYIKKCLQEVGVDVLSKEVIRKCMRPMKHAEVLTVMLAVMREYFMEDSPNSLTKGLTIKSFIRAIKPHLVISQSTITNMFLLSMPEFDDGMTRVVASALGVYTQYNTNPYPERNGGVEHSFNDSPGANHGVAGSSMSRGNVRYARDEVRGVDFTLIEIPTKLKTLATSLVTHIYHLCGKRFSVTQIVGVLKRFGKQSFSYYPRSAHRTEDKTQDMISGAPLRYSSDFSSIFILAPFLDQAIEFDTAEILSRKLEKYNSLNKESYRTIHMRRLPNTEGIYKVIEVMPRDDIAPDHFQNSKSKGVPDTFPSQFAMRVEVFRARSIQVDRDPDRFTKMVHHESLGLNRKLPSIRRTYRAEDQVLRMMFRYAAKDKDDFVGRFKSARAMSQQPSEKGLPSKLHDQFTPEYPLPQLYDLFLDDAKAQTSRKGQDGVSDISQEMFTARYKKTIDCCGTPDVGEKPYRDRDFWEKAISEAAREQDHISSVAAMYDEDDEDDDGTYGSRKRFRGLVHGQDPLRITNGVEDMDSDSGSDTDTDASTIADMQIVRHRLQNSNDVPTPRGEVTNPMLAF